VEDDGVADDADSGFLSPEDTHRHDTPCFRKLRSESGRPCSKSVVRDFSESLQRVPGFVFNPYPANVDKIGGLLPVLANGRWDLILRLKG
jgi:hypothetical protein